MAAREADSCEKNFQHRGTHGNTPVDAPLKATVPVDNGLEVVGRQWPQVPLDQFPGRIDDRGGGQALQRLEGCQRGRAYSENGEIDIERAQEGACVCS